VFFTLLWGAALFGLAFAAGGGWRSALAIAAAAAIAVMAGYGLGVARTRRAQRLLELFPERNPNPVLRLAPDGRVLYANPATTALAAALAAGGGGDARPEAILPPDLGARLVKMRAAAEAQACWEYRLGARTLECRVHYLADLDVFHVYLSDISARKQAEERLVYQAYHDPLTGLPNRRLFQERIGRLLWSQERRGIRTACLLMGLDRFKKVIDSVGHDTADLVMQAVAARLQEVVESCREMCAEAELYRFEGDLFCLLVPGITRGEVPTLVAERIQEGMDRPLYAGGREFFLSFSIGISVFPLDGLDAVTLLRNADTAMRRAKQAGGRAIEYYTQDMNIQALELLRLENYLRHALERGELELYYQPQVETRTGRPVGVEALLRWRHPERGLLAPRAFLEIAEETGLIVPIGEWALATAARTARAWREHQGLPPLTMAVNLSARQFQQQDLPRLVRGVLAETGLSPEALELEITEGTAMHDVEHTAAVLRELKSLGVRLAIDDFGTGFSSLAYLKRFPLDKLKIDQSFIRHLTDDENDAAITRAIIDLGHSLKLTVVAEGVETTEQLARLAQEGCDQVQGYLYGRPAPAAEIAAHWRGGEGLSAAAAATRPAGA
jgi:diguanylate cyclase (GGDEF)-like protein